MDKRIRDNVQSMINQNAPHEDIDGYLKTEGLTPDQFKSGVTSINGGKQAAPKAKREVSYEFQNPFSASSTPLQNLKENSATFGKGLLSGAADIGDTLLSAANTVNPVARLANKFTGGQVDKENAKRQAGLDSFNKEHEGDILFTGGRIAGNIAGTAGVGGAAGAGLKLASKTPRALALAESIANSGMTGTTANKVAGGAVSGALGSLLIDPKDTLKGAAAGSVLPGGSAIANKLFKPKDLDKIAQVKELQGLGYALPPQDVQAGFGSQLLNALGGKIKTEQKLSLANQPITNKIIAQDLGLPEGEKITKEVLTSIRKKAGQDYAAVKNYGRIKADDAFRKNIEDISSQFKGAAADFPELVGDDIDKVLKSVNKEEFDSSSAIDAISLLRDKADKAYRDGDKQLGKASKSAANALEDVIERHLVNIGAPKDVVSNYKESRKLIAKTYTYEKALNDATGNVSATKLGKQLDKGVPLEGKAKKVAQFGNSFRKSAQEVQGVNPYSILDANVGGGLSLATLLNPTTAPITGTMAALVAARPAARNLLASPAYQKLFVNNNKAKLTIGDLLKLNPLAGSLASQ